MAVSLGNIVCPESPIILTSVMIKGAVMSIAELRAYYTIYRLARI
jgi:hypothetical protein